MTATSIDRTVEPLGDDTVPPCFEWLDKHIDENGFQEACLECPRYWVEHDVNAAGCRILDDGEDITAIDCPLLPEEICEKCSGDEECPF